MKKKPLLITLVFLYGILIWMIVTPDKKMSENENRILSSFPKASLSSILDGSFMSDMETYLADQFPVRDWCVSTKTNAMRLIGFKRINDIYIAKDDYLIAKENAYDASKVSDLVVKMEDFASRHEDMSVSFMLAPNQVEILEDKLPYMQESGENKVYKLVKNKSSKLKLVDPRELLKTSKKQVFYKTDHHWTSYGAFLAYSKYESTMGVKIDANDYEFYRVATDFRGTAASNCGIYNIYDNVDICVPKNSVETYNVTFTQEMKKSNTLFDKDKLDGKDKYLVFLGGNNATVVVKSSVNKSGRNILVIKDSFANCMIPMMTAEYDKIVVVDPRYCTDRLDGIIKTQSINEVLFLYNVNSFVEDKSLSDLLGE